MSTRSLLTVEEMPVQPPAKRTFPLSAAADREYRPCERFWADHCPVAES